MSNYPNGPQQPYQPQSNPGHPPQGQPYPQQPGYPPPGYPPQPQQKPKKKGNALWIVLGIVIGAVVLCGVIATATGGKNGSTTTPSSSSSSPSSQPTQAPSQPKTWQTTHTYTGNGAKKTESFTVGSDWKIQWSCNPGTIGMDAPLFITVYNPDGSMFDPGVNTTCKNGQDTTGETQEHQGGTFYLNINAGIQWSITIQEQK